MRSCGGDKVIFGWEREGEGERWGGGGEGREGGLIFLSFSLFYLRDPCMDLFDCFNWCGGGFDFVILAIGRRSFTTLLLAGF